MDGGLRYASLLTDSDIENILKRVDPNITGATIEKREYKRTAAGELLTVDVTIEYIDDDLEQMDMLGGVYPGGDELILIPMGGSVEGELEDLVTVGMPLNYTFLAMYSEDGDLNEFENASGEGSLASAIQFKFQEEPHKVAEVVLQSPFTDGSRIQYRICEDDSFSQFKDSVAAAENYTDVTEINGGQAFCYMDGSEEAEEDMERKIHVPFLFSVC